MPHPSRHVTAQRLGCKLADGSALVVDAMAAARPGCRRGDQADDCGKREGLRQAHMEGPGNELREEGVTGQRRAIRGGEMIEHAGPEQGLDRVVAEERREEDRDRRQGEGGIASNSDLPRRSCRPGLARADRARKRAEPRPGRLRCDPPVPGNPAAALRRPS